LGQLRTCLGRGRLARDLHGIGEAHVRKDLVIG
jgi:hypothetical protein